MARSSTLRILVSIGAGSVIVLTSAPAQAAGSTYVALGDSYSSGTGTRSYLSDGTSCQRSVYAFPSLIASSKGYALNFRACSGATTSDVAAVQLGALSVRTTYVSISAGGNDAGFSTVLTECAKPAWASNCNVAIDQAVGVIDNQLPARLTSLYSAVRSRAPQARVVVAGYPQLFNGVDCNAFTWFSPTEESRLNATADLLNSRLAAAASSAGFTFANPVSSFVHHAVCDRTEWLNGLSYPVTESYHPNRLGHSAGYAPVVGSRLTGSSVTITTATTRQATTSAGHLAAQQRGYAKQDRMISPETFVAPDLSSPAMKAAASRAGVDLGSRASIDAADRAVDALQNAAR